MAYGSALVDNIQSSTANTPVVFKDGNGTQIGTLSRAWVYFDGRTSPATINASFNVSSVTKRGTGYYLVNITTALPSAYYAIVGSSANGAGFAFCTPGANTQTTTQFEILTSTGSLIALGDPSKVSVSVFL